MGGLKLKGMPTRFEREGAKAAEKSAVPAIEKQEHQGTKKTLWEQATTWENSTVSSAAADYGAVIVEPEQYKEVSLTNMFLATFPNCRFRDYLKRRVPSWATIDLHAVWGYDMKHLPPNGKGAAYSDVYNAKLWLGEDKKIHLPIVPTAIAYNCMITRDSLAGNRLASENERRAERRAFEGGFVKDKRLANDFYSAGAIKAQNGDNHIAFLTQALAKILSIKQADEHGSYCEVTITTSLNDNLMDVDLETRDSTSAGIAKKLATPWLGEKGRGMKEMLLPSAAAQPEEVISLLYLVGAFDEHEEFFLRSQSDQPLKITPYFGTVNTNIRDHIRIPLCNAQHVIDLQPYYGKKHRVEVGALEEVLTSYVKRFSLHDQVNIARTLLCAAAISNPLGVKSGQLVAVPKPQHACEYDLWQRVDERENQLMITFSVYEESNLLAALLQVQGEVMRQVTCVQSLQYLHDQRTPMLSPAGKNNYEKWINTTFNKGPRQLISGWCYGILGLSSIEVESLITNNLQAFSDLLWATYMSDAVKVTSQIWGGVLPKSGPIGLIWDKQRRDKEAERSFVDMQTGKVLKSLYNNKHDCFDARGPPLIIFCGATTQVRGLKRDVVASGQRNILNLRGEPKMVFFGTKPEYSDYESRMADAGNVRTLESHYEPAFDLESASSLQEVELALAELSGEGEQQKHDSESKFSGNSFPSNYIKMDLPLPELTPDLKWQTPGRVQTAEPIQDLSYLGQVAMATAHETKYKDVGQWKKVTASRAGWSTSAGGRVVYNSRNSKTNGLAETMVKLQHDAEVRLQEARKTVEKPLLNVGSEIVDPDSTRAATTASNEYEQRDIEEEILGEIPINISRDIHASFDEFNVIGDGRCGIRALHQGLVLINKTRDLKEMMRLECNLLGGTSGRLPATTFIDDCAMALIADELGYHLLVLEQEGTGSDQIDTIRLHRNEQHPDRETLFVKIVSQHWYALQDKVKKPFSTLGEFMVNRKDYTMQRRGSQSPTTSPKPQRTRAGGNDDSPDWNPAKAQRGHPVERRIRKIIKERGGRVGKHAISENFVGVDPEHAGTGWKPKHPLKLCPHNLYWFMVQKGPDGPGGYIWNFEDYVAKPMMQLFGLNAREVNSWAHREMDEDMIRVFVSIVGLSVTNMAFGAPIKTAWGHSPDMTRALGATTFCPVGKEEYCRVVPIYTYPNGSVLETDDLHHSLAIRGIGGMVERYHLSTRRYTFNGAPNANNLNRTGNAPPGTIGDRRVQPKYIYSREIAGNLVQLPDQQDQEKVIATIIGRIQARVAQICGHVAEHKIRCNTLWKTALGVHNPGEPRRYEHILDVAATGFALIGRPADAKWVMHSSYQWVCDVVGERAFSFPQMDYLLLQLVILHRGGRAWVFRTENLSDPDTRDHEFEDWHSGIHPTIIPMVLGHKNGIWNNYSLDIPVKASADAKELQAFCRSHATSPDKKHETALPGPQLPPNSDTGAAMSNDAEQWKLLGLLTTVATSVVVGGVAGGLVYTRYREQVTPRTVIGFIYGPLLSSGHRLTALINDGLTLVGRATWSPSDTIPYNMGGTNRRGTTLPNIMYGDGDGRDRENSFRSWRSLGSWHSFWSVNIGEVNHDEY